MPYKYLLKAKDILYKLKNFNGRVENGIFLKMHILKFKKFSEKLCSKYLVT